MRTNCTEDDDLAPIGLSVYTRLEHMRTTISALQKNVLAQCSELYVFSDAPKFGDEKKVQLVRNFAKQITGFKKVVLIERKENSRVNNNRGGHKFLLKKYGKMIWLEEDIETAPGFLRFVNSALQFYKNQKNIFSITGYTPPIEIGEHESGDVFAINRFNAWGFGTWYDRYNLIEPLKEKEVLSADKSKLGQNGKDVIRMALSDAKGEIDALDVKIMFLQYKRNLLTVYPRISLVQNNGHDGTGVHCRATDIFNHKSLWQKTDNFNFEKNIQVNELVKKRNYLFRRVLDPHS